MRVMPLFKLNKSDGPRELEISMTGLKIGLSVLQIDGGDPSLIAALATTVGLSGHACAVAETDETAEAFTTAAAAEGVLVEIKVGPLPRAALRPGEL